MPVEPGQTLLHYRIVDKLGEGGMGAVWRAVDTTLDREVAIKVLPDAVASDPERAARFEREAKLVASLSHPNIASVYSVHVLDGTRFLAMELVPGEDLSARIARGALPPDEALDVARQVAEALECAHESGVIHRDLKPANVRRTADGRVKVLDFGLAKAVEPTPRGTSSANPSLSPTATSAGTLAGVILGTAAYMSPEQARGHVVDRRADIWSFGCLLYELLTGRQAFEGATVSDTLASILTREPDWSALPSSTPSRVRRLLRRCLDKDAGTRLRDIGEARIALSSAGESEPDAAPIPATASRWPERWAWIALLVVVAGGVAWAGIFGRGASDGADAPFRLDMRRLTELPGPESHPSLSPDGNMFVFTSGAAGNDDIYLLRVGGDRAINLTEGSTFDDSQASFSPDGQSIAFRSERDGGGLFTMGATGESVRRVSAVGFDPAWSPDGEYLAYSDEPVRDPYSRQLIVPLSKVELDTGKTTRLTPPGADGVQPAWSPKGDRIAYWGNTGGQRDIWTVSADGGDPVRVTDDRFTDWSPEWSPDGHWLYFSSDRGGSMDLWRVPIDQDTGLAEGEPSPVTSGTRGFGYERFSADGKRMVVMAYDRTQDLELHEMASLFAGDAEPTIVHRRQRLGWCEPSPDGSWLACQALGAKEDLVLMRADGAEVRRLTDDVYRDRVPLWSPDGKSLAFYSTRSGSWNYWWIRTDGSGLRQVTDIEKDWGGGAMSPDGKQIALNVDYETAVLIDVDKLNTKQSATHLRFPDGYPVGRFWPLAWSSDGRMLAAILADDSGAIESYAVYDLKSESVRRLDIEAGAGAPEPVAGWLPGTRKLVLRDQRGYLVYDVESGARQRLPGVGPEATVALSTNGKVLLVEHEVLDSEIWLLTLE